MKKILLDTNFLMIPSQFNLDIFEVIDEIMEEEYELFTIDGVVKELEKLAKIKGKDGVAAKIALNLIHKKNIKVMKTKEKNIDEAIIKITDKDTIVATNDRILRKKLKNKNVKTIYLRAKKHLKLS